MSNDCVEQLRCEIKERRAREGRVLSARICVHSYDFECLQSGSLVTLVGDGLKIIEAGVPLGQKRDLVGEGTPTWASAHTSAQADKV